MQLTGENGKKTKRGFFFIKAQGNFYPHWCLPDQQHGAPNWPKYGELCLSSLTLALSDIWPSGFLYIGQLISYHPNDTTKSTVYGGAP